MVILVRGGKFILLANRLTLERIGNKVNTETLDKYTQELIEQSIERGKYIAYREMMELLTAEADKHPTTSAVTLGNLWVELGKLLGIKY
jgi:hypothetical protein